MAADVVGYSRLIGRDEEGAVRRLRRLQAAITRIVEANQGRIANTAGDAMLVEFSSSVAALDSALAIQEAVGPLNLCCGDDDEMLLRIGVNVGEVIVESGDVFGEVVNVASRLEAIAEPGGICASHAFFVQTKARFAVNFVDLGEQRLKNIAEPVRAYAVRPPWVNSVRRTASSPSAGAVAAGPAEDFDGTPSATATRLVEQREIFAHSPEVFIAPKAMTREALAADIIPERLDQRQVDLRNIVRWPGRVSDKRA
jgi:adenylate cyclase